MLNVITFILNGMNVVVSLPKMLTLLINSLGVLSEIRAQFIFIVGILGKTIRGVELNYADQRASGSNQRSQRSPYMKE